MKTPTPPFIAASRLDPSTTRATVSRRKALVQSAAATLCLLAASRASLAAVSISGTALARAGNNGNVIVQQAVSANANGSYAVGPLSGPDFGGNATQGGFTISSFPRPTLTAFASGYDSGVYAANGAATFVSINYTYALRIDGPMTGVAVPYLFAGSTSGTTSFSGNPASNFDSVGTSIDITSIGLGESFHGVGPQTGTLPGISFFDSQHARIGWGTAAATDVTYSSYTASYLYGATLLSGPAALILEVSTIINGGTSSTTTPTGVVSTGSAASMIDPYVYIDPIWLASHPGYSVVVDDGVGNSPIQSVPEPASWGLTVAGLVALVAGRRKLGRPRL